MARSVYRPVVYTDGACTNNGRRDFARGGIGIFWEEPRFHKWNVSLPLGYGPQTNQRAELMAASVAIDIAIEKNIKYLELRTDSAYVIYALTHWIPKFWIMNGWKNAEGRPVWNRQEFEELWYKIEDSDIDVLWTKIPREDNTEADYLAKEGVPQVDSVYDYYE